MGRVVGLSLSENELSGGLPASLGLLEQLTEIRIDGIRSVDGSPSP